MAQFLMDEVAPVLPSANNVFVVRDIHQSEGLVKAHVHYFCIFHQKQAFKKLWKTIFISTKSIDKYSG